MSVGLDLDAQRRRLDEAFHAPDRRRAHERAAPVLREMASDPGILHEILWRRLTEPEFFSKQRINPVLAFDVFRTPAYDLIAHVWMPLPDRATDITHQSVHHHGHLLLTSVAAYGPGYQSLLFKRGFEVLPSGETRMRIDKDYTNHLGSTEFIETFTPHVVFYPTDLSVTYALWSHEVAASGIASRLRSLPVVQKHKSELRSLLSKLGLAASLGVNQGDKFDFYPHEGRLWQLAERVMYPVGSNENFVQNVLHVLQRVEHPRVGRLAASTSRLAPHEQTVCEPWMSRLRDGAPIPDLFDPAHAGIAKVNFTREALLRAVATDQSSAHTAAVA